VRVLAERSSQAFTRPVEEYHFVLVCPFVDLIKVDKCKKITFLYKALVHATQQLTEADKCRYLCYKTILYEATLEKRLRFISENTCSSPA